MREKTTPNPSLNQKANGKPLSPVSLNVGPYKRGEVMATRVFFSFHYQDVINFRANVFRQHWMTKPHREAAGFFDASIWGSAELSGDVGIKRVINSGLEGTTVTFILIGSETCARKVRYEILES